MEGYAFSLIYTDAEGTAAKITGSTTGIVAVQQGDTLSGIAKKLGKTRDYLIKKNRLTNPDKLSIGQKIQY